MEENGINLKMPKKMEDAVNGRISDISTEIQSKRAQIEKIKNDEKMKPSKRDKELSAINKKISDLEYQKGLLDDFINGLHALGQNPDITYTFNPSDDAFQTNTFQEIDGVITINYQEHSYIGMANMVHETTHAIQDYRKQVRNNNLMFCETNAYSTQYAFSPDSFKYILNEYNPTPRISSEWVKGVYYIKEGKRVYPYKGIE